ncbi:reverse transcriptase, RNA-dependent DNA polymerase [Artemisia annua]|uniref:Reverse transcriptase, RNA-dependent DNA polymerase n=1 Tax=Artemisia annua TaxID=35608 RepID=A0A2U1QB67_ARTAN|nr:reverse transcriptase, RNA-dependent DNA polymerase [Artemisia annua]
MATTTSAGVAVKTLMIVLLCLMVAAFAYLFAFGDSLDCFDLHARWALELAMDFTVYVAVLGAWYAYKESSWIIAIPLMITMYFLGSIITIGYILIQFYKLSPEESSKDPLYFVLARRQKRDVVGHTGRHSSVVTARVIYSALGCMALGNLIYSVYVDLSPSHIKYITSCFWTNGTDMYIHVVIFSVWVAYKESSWITAFFWILSIFCFRGLPICVYVVRQLYNLSPQQPASLIIFKNNTDRYLDASDPPLMAHSNV